jgi:peptidoglycan hydrolase-like protein with peptidoglycan-binding domain
MRVLKLGCTGEDVTAWETFLVGLSYYWVEVDGVFDESTVSATKMFQSSNGLTQDGTVGPMTWSTALRLGFPGVADDSMAESGPNWPPKPDFGPMSAADRSAAFGTFSYVPAGIPGNPEAIKITDDWASKNIMSVNVPQLKGITGSPSSSNIPFHSKAAAQLIALWKAWEDAGLLPLVESFAGSWVPRYVRGSRIYLSNHAWGTAFDINAGYNPLGAVPALVGKKGSVRKLVELANDNGFYWGGHFGFSPDGSTNGRHDGMHFEIARTP